MTAPIDPGMCMAISQPGTPLTAFVAGWAVKTIARPGRDFICTQHPDHRGEHSSCDGHGHILARWPRRKSERYWHPGDCDGCAHHRQAKAVLN